MRELCESCYHNPKAINYVKDGKTYYRKFCNSCNSNRKKKLSPTWKEQGYKKKFKCESCNFVAKHTDQLTIIEHKKQYRTICLNCDALYKVNGTLEIRTGDLRSDF